MQYQNIRYNWVHCNKVLLTCLAAVDVWLMTLSSLLLWVSTSVYSTMLESACHVGASVTADTFLSSSTLLIDCWWHCSPKHMIYYKRELLCRSLDGHRIDLITVSDCRGMSDVEEPRFDSRLFPDTSTCRCRMFSGKKVCCVVML